MTWIVPTLDVHSFRVLQGQFPAWNNENGRLLRKCVHAFSRTCYLHFLQMHVDLFGPVDAFVTPELVIMGAEWAMVYMQKESVLKKQQTWRPPSQTTLQPEPSREAPEVPRLRRARVAAKPRSRLRTIGTTDTILSCAIPHLQLRVFQALRPTSGPSGEMAATKLVLKGVRSVVLRSVASQDSPASLGYSVSSDMVYGTMQLLNRNSSRSPSVQVPHSHCPLTLSFHLPPIPLCTFAFTHPNPAFSFQHYKHRQQHTQVHRTAGCM